jgi:transposase
LQLLEQQSEQGQIELYYGDETRVSEEGYVPYGWQFQDENISIASTKGKALNCFGMITRANDFEYATTQQPIDTEFIIAHLDAFSWRIKKPTVVVLDNARVHQSKRMRAIQPVWAKRGLFIFFLPPYSPKLNIIERLWKEMKARWIQPSDYDNDQQLFYSVHLILNAIGKDLFLNYKRITIT